MANAFNKNTKQYLESVNTPDFNTTDWIINPDLSTVRGVNPKFWIINLDDTIRPMTKAERNAEFLDEAKEKEKQRINEYRDKLIHDNGYVYQGNKFDSDQYSSFKIMAGTLAATITASQGQDLPPDFVWRDYNNVNRQMNAATMIAFGTSFFNYGTAVYKASWTHKANIDSLTTIDDVNGYDSTQGWPSQ